MIGSATDLSAPEDFINAETGLTACLIETGATGRLEWIDGQVSVLSFSRLKMMMIKNIQINFGMNAKSV